MAAKVAQSAGARVLLLKAPHKRRVAHRQSPCLIILHVHMINIANEPALDQIFCVTRRGLKAVREAHHALYAALFCHLRKVIRLLARHHNGLFHRIRLSGLRRRKRHLVVYVVRRGNIHRVHIRAVDEVVVIRKAMRLVNAVFFLRVTQRLGVNVAHRDQLQIRAAFNARQMHVAGNTADADAANSNTTHNLYLPTNLSAFQ